MLAEARPVTAPATDTARGESRSVAGTSSRRAGSARPGDARLGGAPGRVAVLLLGLGLLLALVAASLLLGAGELTPAQVLAALQHDDRSPQAVIVWDMRVTRTLTALLVGLALGVGGILMQGITRNPLADPGLLGVSGGAGLAIVLAVGFLGLGSFSQYIPFALLGALLASVLVYAIGFGAGNRSPATLVLVGTAITAVATGIATALALVDASTFNALRGWMAGSVTGRSLAEIGGGAALIALGLLGAIALARPVGQLSLGDDLARALGVRVVPTRIGGALAVMVLAGTATALAGPIVFIGLMVPHLARALVGPRGGWMLVYGGLAGALILLAADVLGRLVIAPLEAPAGIVTAIVGAPVLAMLARGRRGDEA